MYDLILKKRRGFELSADEIEFLVNSYTGGSIPDYQMAAWLMAVFFQGLSLRETIDLTMAMACSGTRLDLSEVPGVKVDKHSTGGVGDKTTLVLAPLLAACGVPVAKMSGRGLGHTGGTIDKLASIPGFKTDLDIDTFRRQVKEIGLAITGAGPELAPADKKIYALRDVTATVDSIPLIASSVMSKKIAGGADALVLDVKTGDGAFMKEVEAAVALARVMVDIGNGLGLKTVALVTDMNQPLGFAVGNAVEVREAISTLRGDGPADLADLCLGLGSEMLLLAERARDRRSARALLAEALATGAALHKFAAWVKAQGGDDTVVHDPSRLPRATRQVPITAPAGGYVCHIAAEKVGRAAVLLGAGRRVKDEPVDPAAGIVLKKKVGAIVKEKDVLAVLHTNRDHFADAEALLLEAFTLGPTPPSAGPLILYMINANGVFPYGEVGA
ncbi:MAG: pyrimidine-nucleoside phosphorylase [Desulfotomaculales bacterium]